MAGLSPSAGVEINMAGSFMLSVVTPEEAVLEAEASYANVPAHDGQIGILQNRAPLLVQLGHGVLEARLADGETRQFDVEGGFAQMRDNKLTILCEKATETTDARAD
jgi:F-type H+-transporting ATPase subunit epsilon